MEMKKLKHLLLLLLVNFTFAQCFLISGIVKDSIEPIPYATILIKGKNKGTLTDFNGKFSLPVEKNDTLLINYLGKLEFTLKVETDSFVTIVLKDAPEIKTVLPVEPFKPKRKKIIEPTTEVTDQQINSKKIYLLGGIASVITEKEINFSKKYNIQFHDLGCIHPEKSIEYEKSNCEIFNYLNEKFGKQWQKEINPYTLGLQNWLKK